MIKSSKVKIPSNLQLFLNNGENKERLFELIEGVIIENAGALSKREIFYVRKDKCKKISNIGVSEEFTLNHEEADTKVTCFVQYATTINKATDDDVVVVRSPSGDIDIPVIMLAGDVSGNVFIENGTSKNRKLHSLAQWQLSDVQKKALLGVHTFTGTDQNSSMLRKGKMRCWKIAQGHLETFAELGENYHVSDELIEKLEKFVIELYSCKTTTVDQARNIIFWDTLRKKKRIVDLSMLPTCRKSLILHIRRSNYLSRLWRQASIAETEIACPTEHGWNADYSLSGLIPSTLITCISC